MPDTGKGLNYYVNLNCLQSIKSKNLDDLGIIYYVDVNMKYFRKYQNNFKVFFLNYCNI